MASDSEKAGDLAAVQAADTPKASEQDAKIKEEPKEDQEVIAGDVSGVGAGEVDFRREAIGSLVLVRRAGGRSFHMTATRSITKLTERDFDIERECVLLFQYQIQKNLPEVDFEKEEIHYQCGDEVGGVVQRPESLKAAIKKMMVKGCGLRFVVQPKAG